MKSSEEKEFEKTASVTTTHVCGSDFEFKPFWTDRAWPARDRVTDVRVRVYIVYMY